MVNDTGPANLHAKYCQNENLWVLRQAGKRATAWCPECGTLFFRVVNGVHIYPPNTVRREEGMGEFDAAHMDGAELKA